jgi:tRNA-dihydrouridine synthase A
MLSHKISIAPMLDVTNIFFRFFMRLLTRKAALYTEMINCNTIINHVKGYEEVLKFNKIEHPVVV